MFDLLVYEQFESHSIYHMGFIYIIVIIIVIMKSFKIYLFIFYKNYLSFFKNVTAFVLYLKSSCSCYTYFFVFQIYMIYKFYIIILLYIHLKKF